MCTFTLLVVYISHPPTYPCAHAHTHTQGGRF